MPDDFKKIKIPEWPIPIDLKKWQEVDRARTRQTLLQCLGEIPPRPDPKRVKVVSTEDMGDYIQERFEFHNGVDATVPGIILIPKSRKGRAEARGLA